MRATHFAPYRPHCFFPTCSSLPKWMKIVKYDQVAASLLLCAASCSSFHFQIGFHLDTSSCRSVIFLFERANVWPVATEKDLTPRQLGLCNVRQHSRRYHQSSRERHCSLGYSSDLGSRRVFSPDTSASSQQGRVSQHT